MANTGPDRCPWPGIEDPLYTAYHDHEWGVPALDDQRLFEMLVLETQQAGLSWLTILKRRERYRLALRGFDPCYTATLQPHEVASLAQNHSLLRHSGKLLSLSSNAQAFLRIAARYGSFGYFLWSQFDFTPKTHSWNTLETIPAQTAESVALTDILKKAGFSFVGPVMIYAYLQAVGVYNDHLVSCFRYKSLSAGSSQSLAFRKKVPSSRSGT
ncbi:MAG: DNA-3-methyladenine glycosylase I [Gammaproteobacteria bacterium]